MKYDLKEIGKKIRKERKIRNWTQEDFAENLGMSCESRRTICDWEKGRKLPNIEYLFEMCELFSCELGYLLCEPQYNYKTEFTSFIGDNLGLSEESTKKLIRILKNDSDDGRIILDKIIQHRDFESLLRRILVHVASYNENNRQVYFGFDERICKDLYCTPQEVEEYLKKSSEIIISSTLFDIIDCIYVTKEITYKKDNGLRIHKLFDLPLP